MLRPAMRKTLRPSLSKTRKRRISFHLKGIRRRSKLLFVGPPGCGKSFTAQAIANELDLPLFVVRSRRGDRGISRAVRLKIHLREIFRFVSGTPMRAVIQTKKSMPSGKQRGRVCFDVGELDRIVIALMQELEFLQTNGVVIATSNLPKNLDRALWRRFDLVLAVPFTRARLPELGNSMQRRMSTKFGLKPTQILRSSNDTLRLPKRSLIQKKWWRQKRGEWHWRKCSINEPH